MATKQSDVLGSAAADARETLRRGEQTPEANAFLRADAAAFAYVNHLPHTRNGDELVGTLSDVGRGAGWLVAAAWLGWKGGRVGRRAGLETALALGVATVLVEGPIKHYFRRRRPFDVIEDRILVGKPPTDTSFPSGHTTTGFACATVLSAAYPNQAGPLFGAAAGVGLSRVYLGQHYPSDVLVGAALGTALGVLTRKLNIFRRWA